MGRFLAVLHARNMEYFRDYSALGWNLVFPFLLVIAFTIVFTGNPTSVYKVGLFGAVVNGKTPALLDLQYIEFIDFKDLNTAIEKVKHHQIDLLVQIGEPLRYWVNSSSPKGYFLERLLTQDFTAEKKPGFEREAVEGQEIRYVDWALPGILAMNMMFSCLFGIGYVIVRYRKNGVLKRLKATPLTAMEFLSAQVVSRLLIITVVTAVVFIGCDLTIGFHMAGSYGSLLVVLVLGSLCMISLGLIMATRTTSEEFAGGMLNLLSWPMMILSGVWFSMEGAHPTMQFIAKLLPLTHIIDAARSIMIDGASLWDVGFSVTILAGMTFVFLLAGAMAFKWE